MRYKISFLKNRNMDAPIPLHHQHLIASSIEEIVRGLGFNEKFYTFSSLKGTSRINSGYIRFLSSKVTLALACRDKQFIESVVRRIFEQQGMMVGDLRLHPKTFEIIHDPEFKTKMKYVCIAPIVLHPPREGEEESNPEIDVLSHEFSDLLYQSVMENMEKAGYTSAQLDSYAVFEATADQEYVHKLNITGKKYARIYHNTQGLSMRGYLVPFSLHAHPDVHKFIWECGIGILNNQGYGMVDIAQSSFPGGF